MAEIANYFITGVWFSDIPNRHVSSVMLHETPDGKTFKKGIMQSKDAVIALLERGKNIQTLTWCYNTERIWYRGAFVSIEHLQSGKYLRSNPDKSAKDNLDNLINMGNIV